MKNERTYGLIRRFDDLGRLVIPKELRRQLEMNPEDAVEITVSGRMLQIRKFHPLQALDTVCKLYLDAFWKSCRNVCVVCSTEQVVATRGMDFSNDMLLSEEVRGYIQRREEYQYSEDNQIRLFENSKYLVDSLYPIGTESNPAGAVIFIHFREATSTERGCARYMADILTELVKQKEVW